MAEAFQAPAAWHPQHLILIPQTKPSLFSTTDIVLLLCRTPAIDYEDAAPLCRLGKMACRSELPTAEGHLRQQQSWAESVGFRDERQKLTSGTAGAVLECILPSC